MLLMSNFLPAILIPTRIAGRSATLIDHIYYNLGSKYNVDAKHISGNFLQDIADHLPNYFVIYSNKPNTENCRPLVRILSEVNKAKFLEAYIMLIAGHYLYTPMLIMHMIISLILCSPSLTLNRRLFATLLHWLTVTCPVMSLKLKL